MKAARQFDVGDLWSPDKPLPGKGTLQAITERLGRAWEVADLPGRVRLVYNPRLRTTLGRAILTDLCVELNTRLLREHPDQLIPTLAHELAHIVAHIRYGRVAPHGEHFRTLMRAVNLSSKATHDLPVGRLIRRHRRFLYLHRCSDCGYSFTAHSLRRNCYCLACGPDMSWSILRAPNSSEGRKTIKRTMGELLRR